MRPDPVNVATILRIYKEERGMTGRGPPDPTARIQKPGRGNKRCLQVFRRGTADQSDAPNVSSPVLSSRANFFAVSDERT